ncbi:MAG TPA: universal stress protein [Aliidongia sp.]|nr:universal stress protein [Aliidongia sp.]
MLIGGSETDDAVLGTALGAASALDAHLQFLHVELKAGEAAVHTPHVDFAMGAALRAALDHLAADQAARSAAAKERFEHFCAAHRIAITDAPSSSHRVAADLRVEQGDALNHMLQSARYNDLVILGRPTRANGLPPDLAELLLVGSGRPMLLAPARARPRLDTAMVCWKETATSARALAAAMPLLEKARRVIILGIREAGDGSPAGIQALARRLAWHGFEPEIRWVAEPVHSVADRIEAEAAECDADLIVMGGYSHNRAREVIFGGCTQHFLEGSDRPVLLMH